MSPPDVVARIHAHGHPNLRLTHDATVELSEDAEITARATCVLGVGARVTSTRPSGPPGPSGQSGLSGHAGRRPEVGWAGPLRFRFRVPGEREVVVDGWGNPEHVAGGGFVLRRSGDRRDDTVATGCTAAASDFPRAWLAVMQRRDTSLTVDVERLARRHDGRDTIVLAHAPRAEPVPASVAAWLASGHVVWDVDGSGASATPPAHDGVLVVVARDRWPGVVVPAIADADAVAWETAGLAPHLAVAAVLGGPAPVVLAAEGAGTAGADRALAVAGGRSRVVVALRPQRASALLRSVAALGSARPAAVMFHWRRADRAIERGDASALADHLAVHRHDVLVGLGEDRAPIASTAILRTAGERGSDPVAGPATEAEPFDAAVVRALLAGGVPVRTVVDALCVLPGVRRNAVHRWVRSLVGATAPAAERP